MHRSDHRLNPLCFDAFFFGVETTAGSGGAFLSLYHHPNVCPLRSNKPSIQLQSCPSVLLKRPHTAPASVVIHRAQSTSDALLDVPSLRMLNLRVLAAALSNTRKLPVMPSSIKKRGRGICSHILRSSASTRLKFHRDARLAPECS